MFYNDLHMGIEDLIVSCVSLCIGVLMILSVIASWMYYRGSLAMFVSIVLIIYGISWAAIMHSFGRGGLLYVLIGLVGVGVSIVLYAVGVYIGRNILHTRSVAVPWYLNMGFHATLFFGIIVLLLLVVFGQHIVEWVYEYWFW